MSPLYDTIYTPESVPGIDISLPAISRFLELALGLSAWKKSGHSLWAVRNNPSSGNLHPTEGYIILPSLAGIDLKAGIYHYAPKEHGLELRKQFFDGNYVSTILY